MARYRTTIQSKKSPEETFEYLADFANAREWDPGVVEGENLTGRPLGAGSRFRLVYKADLRLKGPLGRLTEPLLGLALRRIGDRAASGLRNALNL